MPLISEQSRGAPLPTVPAAVDVPIPPADEPLDNPRELYIEVTNRCNSLCVTCPLTFSPQEAEHYLGFDELTNLVDQFPALRRVVLQGIGEPLMNRQLAPMIRYLKDRGVYVIFNTNAILLYPKRQVELVESGLDELRVSCDSSTPETYAKIRGVNLLPKVLKNVGEMMQTRQRLGAERPRVSLWFTGVKENIEELPGLVDIAGQMGVDEVYLTRMVFFGEGLATEDQSIFNAEEALSRQVADIVAEAERRAVAQGIALKSAGALAPSDYASGPGEVRNPWQGCRRPWRLGYVTANGNALPCCVAPFTDVPYEDLILGNVKDGGFNAVWNGQRYRDFRNRHQSDDPPDACRRCGLDWSL
ncbi:MAG TPA: radical SAM protein [Chloroflexota bacterium]|nr:radical SAM protein [Chloroflexota bacterium]